MGTLSTIEVNSLRSGKESPGYSSSLRDRLRIIERRDWMLWACAVLITLLLSVGIVSFDFSAVHFYGPESNFSPLSDTVMGLIGMVLLFDIYTIYQHLQIQGVRKQLIEREEIFRLITENAADMIAVVDAKGRCLYNSPSYEKILGYSPQELTGTKATDRIHPEDQEKVLAAAADARRTGVGTNLEYRMCHKNGLWRTLESRASTIVKDGRVEKLVIVNRDITERKHLEEQFRQAQKMEAVGRLSGGVAHDFNNLLGLIIGYGEMIQEATQPQNPLRPCIDEILKAGHRAASLTKQLLAFSRQQMMAPRILDLNSVVRDMEKMLRRLIGEDIQLRTALHPTLVRIKADQGQIEQVILNLAVNARDAMPSGGELRIQTSNFLVNADFASEHSYPMSLGNYVQLTVTDTGVGMDAVTRAQVFEPFFTTKERGKGTGLGLSMVYGVVKQSGGYIDVVSEPGAGATFKIYLPKAERPVPEKGESEASATLRGSETVLLVEDEHSLRKLTRQLLEACGYHVIEAETGDQALKLNDEHKDTIQLLLTDVVMPGISGRMLADELVLRRPGIRVLFMSGYTGQTIGEHGVLAEGSLFLAKPFTREVLASKIREALDGKAVPEQSNGRTN